MCTVYILCSAVCSVQFKIYIDCVQSIYILRKQKTLLWTFYHSFKRDNCNFWSQSISCLAQHCRNPCGIFDLFLLGRVISHASNSYSGMQIFRTTQGNRNWFEKLGGFQEKSGFHGNQKQRKQVIRNTKNRSVMYIIMLYFIALNLRGLSFQR